MKKIIIVTIMLCISFVQIAMAQADPQINMNAVTNSVMPGTQGQINVTICNNGPNSIPGARLRPLISTGSAAIIITGATNTDGSPITGFTIQAQSNGSIRLLYTNALANNSCVSFYVTVQGVSPSPGPGELFTCTLGFQLPVTGNNAGNDNSTTTVLVSALVPVTITAFSGNMMNCAANLRWTTSTEENSSRYDIEISSDGISYTKDGTVPSRNNPTGASYTYTVNKPVPGKNFFRIRSVDFDGVSKYSNVVMLTNTCTGNGTVFIFPNPATDMVSVSGLTGRNRIAVLDMAGKCLTNIMNSAATEQLSIKNYAKGTYVIRVVSESGDAKNFMLVKE